jgi:hypothetical protein
MLTVPGGSPNSSGPTSRHEPAKAGSEPRCAASGLAGRSSYTLISGARIERLDAGDAVEDDARTFRGGPGNDVSAAGRCERAVARDVVAQAPVAIARRERRPCRVHSTSGTRSASSTRPGNSRRYRSRHFPSRRALISDDRECSRIVTHRQGEIPVGVACRVVPVPIIGRATKRNLPWCQSLRPQPIGDSARDLCRRLVGHREHRTDVDLAEHVVVGPVGAGRAKHEVCVPDHR